MPAEYVQGFSVGEASWHRSPTETVFDPASPPTWEEAFVAAGHNFVVVKRPMGVFLPLDPSIEKITEETPLLPPARPMDGFQVVGREIDGRMVPFQVARDSYALVQNETAWDFLRAFARATGMDADRLPEESSGGILSGGAILWVTLPVDDWRHAIPGDPSPIRPFAAITWSHDGSGALTCDRTTIRRVCRNTHNAAEREAQQTGLRFSFRHTSKVEDRIGEAMQALTGVREAHEDFLILARELAAVDVSRDQVTAFIRAFIPSPPDGIITDRVARNIEEARGAVQAILNGPTCEGISASAWGLFSAAVEYLDHVRTARSWETRAKRSIIRGEPLKRSLPKLIAEVMESVA